MSFYIGQKVECINDAPMPGMLWYPKAKPTLGHKYTICGIGKGKYGNYSVLFLNEIENEGGYGYRSTRFRPVVERKTDISIFKAMLMDQKIGEKT